MKRYHKSFLGMMEQSKDGNWLLFTDVCEEFDTRNEKFRERINQICEERDIAQQQLKVAKDIIEAQQLELKAGKIIIGVVGLLWLAYALNDCLPYILLYFN